MARRNRRKDRRRINWSRKHCHWGAYVEGCRGHPGVVIETYFSDQDWWGDSVTVKSLIDDVEESCSLMHCGVWPMSKAQAEERAAYWKKHGSTAYRFKYFPEAYDTWIEHWNEVNSNPENANNKNMLYVWGVPILEYLHLTQEEYDRFIVKKDIP